ncbi:MAG: segregation/condensation protein A [Bifidobacteriaceae bacterium]|jgi:segregation and condensation protein A|nr:segregation/condensation protein A [Bifidobacteriaceae bacterium]
MGPDEIEPDDSAGAEADADAAEGAESAPNSGFTVSLDVYQGPFDILLSMIAQRRLEVTQLALSDITSEFISYVSSMDMDAHADEASEFLVVASVLVEAKSAALLPGDSDPADEQSLEALRERDLLFARLLQYKAFKQAGEDFRTRLASNSGRYEHHPELSATLRAKFSDVEWTLSPYDFALVAAKVFANAPAQKVSLRQLHVPLADLRTESAVVHDVLWAVRGTAVTFDELVADTTNRGQVVARFLSVLVFFKQGFVQFKQEGPFEPLALRWVASAEEYDAGGSGISAADFA